MQKAQNADQRTDHKKMLTKKAQAAVNKAMHLLAIELNLEKGPLEHTLQTPLPNARQGTTCNLKCKLRNYGRSGIYPLSHRLKRGNPKKIRTGKAASQPTTVQGLLKWTG